MSRIKERRLFWALLMAGLVADLGSKMWAEAALRPAGWVVGHATPVHPVIEGVFAWKWAGNVGAAFSMLAGQVALLAIIGVAVLIGIVVYAYRVGPQHRGMHVALGLVSSGAVGNIVDRMRLGYVRDFMYFDFDLPFHESVGFIPQRYPVFNVADIAILTGAILLVIASRKLEQDEKAATPSATGSSSRRR